MTRKRIYALKSKNGLVVDADKIPMLFTDKRLAKEFAEMEEDGLLKGLGNLKVVTVKIKEELK